ncbi:sigma-70 family RNA polymerase sigma factor [Nocardiopsis aegyptia]|uniref:RNA polymerase sigma factor (Sigma-70 family) n=1 Tax=Nocardiopsis aegyptia TaxID=220378 RepID=A0A7Z0JBX9_9ACTN|nr:sigma-70 family RNA polymerase sigma factor [Nocardiopsis aegyptia]NYJ36317.1 RNA polymerase sigma factor (sigma-70 family) [Nocardiopsis aegyptia]
MERVDTAERTSDAAAHALVAAARDGDRRALDALVAEYLPLIYNIVGRALDGHADVDDVVQETLVRAVRGIRKLRRPEDFRSWLVAIAMRQITDRGRARQRAFARGAGTGPDDAEDLADPGGDFTDLTIMRLALTGQRRETARATRWLDPDDRRLLSLWWLEAMGELTRDELAAALRLSNAHAAVRVQRVKAQLTAARAVVRALAHDPRCPGLADLARRWDGVPSPLWRKRFARHTRDCRTCHTGFADQVPAERLLAPLSLVPVPAGLAGSLLADPTGPLAAVLAAGAARAGWWPGFGAAVAAKPLVAGSLAATVAGSALVTGIVVYEEPRPAPPSAAATAPEQEVPAVREAPAGPVEPPEASESAEPTPEPEAVEYGSVVSGPEELPANEPPGDWPRRPEGERVRVVAGVYEDHGGFVQMVHRDEHVVLSGQGYVRVRYQLAFWDRPGSMVMPTWTGLEGRLFHVASGGGRRMDEPQSADHPDSTGMGSPEEGYIHLPEGARQIWQNEFFYLDGTVTLTHHERGASYGLAVAAMTWDGVNDDVSTGPEDGSLRYGDVHDTGDDAAPVPQYLTREETSDPAAVPQEPEL